MNYALVLTAVAVALLAHHLYPWLLLSGYLTAVAPTNHQHCRIAVGPPDFRNCEHVLIAEPGVAYAGCDPARDFDNMVMDVHQPKQYEEQGHVWRMDYVSDPPTMHKVTDELALPDGFHPLGMTLMGDHRLYAINLAHHAPASIEVFDVSSPSATHVQTIRHPVIHTPNSLFPWGSDGSFFFTNDHRFITGIAKKIENFARIPLGTVGFYNASAGEAYTVASGMLFPNGVAGDEGESVLFVAETYRMVVNKYTVTRGKDTGRMHVSPATDQIKLSGTAVDNLHYDAASGDLLITGHPDGLALIKKSHHATDNSSRAPSRVVVWHTRQQQQPVTETVFEDDGTNYGTSATAVSDHTNNKLLISGLYEKGIMICNQNDAL